MTDTQTAKPEELEIAPDPAIDQQQPQQEFTPPPPANDRPQPEKKEPERVHMSPQDAARAEIAARFRKTREDPDDVGYHGDHNDPTQHYGAVAKPEEPATDKAPDAPTDPQKRMVKLKVRGQEMEVPEEEVIADAQKYRAADDYLGEARRILEDSRRVRSSRPHQGEEEPAPVARQDDGHLDADPQRHPADEDDPFEKLVETIQYGDKKEAAEALRNTLRTVTREEGQQEAWKERINESLIQDTREYQEFVGKNAEIARDENAVAVVRKNFIEGYREDLRKIGVPEDRIPRDEETLARHHRIYKLKGQPVRQIGQLLENAKGKFQSWMGGFPRQQTPPAPIDGRVQVNVDRTERRAAIPQQPSRAAVPPQMQRPQTPPGQRQDMSSVVQHMRASRGQV